MAPSEMRYALLAGLAWRLWTGSLGCRLEFPRCAEPVLYVRCGDGSWEPVVAVQGGHAWLLVWRGVEVDAAKLDEAARKIVAAA